MRPHDGTCSCIGELEQRELASQFADRLSCDLVDTMGFVCPAMMDFIVEQIVARMVHVAIYRHDASIEHNERKTLEAAAAYIYGLSKTAPAALKLIMDEVRVKGEPANARH